MKKKIHARKPSLGHLPIEKQIPHPFARTANEFGMTGGAGGGAEARPYQGKRRRAVAPKPHLPLEENHFLPQHSPNEERSEEERVLREE